MTETPTARPPLTLLWANFAAGWALMMMEILGGRMMAPHYGYSVYQWGAIIGVVMGFMAIGYWLGGERGEGPKAAETLRLALLGGLFAAALTPWLGKDVLEDIALRTSAIGGSVIGASVILAVPAFALAMVSPLCLGLTARAGAGAAGRIQAFGTLGCIGGTFFASFVAIPDFGVSAGYAMAALPVAVALWFVPGSKWAAVLALFLVPVAWAAGQRDGNGFLVYRETAHNTIMVIEDEREVRLHLNTRWATQSRLRRDGGPTGLYYDLLAVAPALADQSQRGDRPPRVLVLGLAGGAAATGILRHWPDAEITGVELDAGVVEVAYQHFALPPQVKVVVEDARRFIDRDRASYDVIIVDLYSTAVIPFFTATQEFFRSVAERLAPGGALVMNVASPAEPDVLVGPLAATQRTIFPSVHISNAGRGNYLLIANREPVTVAALDARLLAVPAGAEQVADELRDTLRLAPIDGHPVLTDDHTDIDRRGLVALYGR